MDDILARVAVAVAARNHKLSRDANSRPGLPKVQHTALVGIGRFFMSMSTLDDEIFIARNRCWKPWYRLCAPPRMRPSRPLIELKNGYDYEGSFLPVEPRTRELYVGKLHNAPSVSRRKKRVMGAL